MLRITDRMGQLTCQLDLARAQYRLAMQQREASSGLRLNQASDDPGGAASLVRIEANLEQVRQCSDNISRATGELTTADDALASVTDLLIDARELSISMANGSYTAAERADAALQVQQIREQLIAIANTEFDGKHIFGGYRTEAAPYDPTGTYLGDGNTRLILAAPGLQVGVSISGDEVFNPVSGQDVLTNTGVLASLQTALATNDLTGIQNATAALGEAQTQVTSARARLGIDLDRLMSLDSMMGSRLVQLAGARAEVRDADAVESLSSLVLAQQSLTATLKVSAQVLSKLSLVDAL